MSGILTFDTTHHALLAEEIAHVHGLAAEIMPAPAEARAKCDLALEFLLREKESLCTLLEAAGVNFCVYRG